MIIYRHNSLVIGVIMKTLREELSFEHDLFKMCRIINLALMLLGFILLIVDIMYVGLIIVGTVDVLCLEFAYQVFKRKRLKALYNPFETVGKHVLYIGIGAFMVTVLIDFIVHKDHAHIAPYLIFGLVVLILVHFLTRFLYFKEILNSANPKEDNSMGHYNLVTFFKNEAEVIYITDADIQAPFYGVHCGEFEIIHEQTRYRGKNYKTYPILKYLLEHDKKFEDLTEEEFKMFENMKHFE